METKLTHHRRTASRSRGCILVLCIALAAALSPVGTANGTVLEQVIDLVAEGDDLGVGSLGSTLTSSGRSDGLITAVTTSGGPPPLVRVYELDPSAGESQRIATIDPVLIKPNATAVLAIPTPTGEVYFVIEDFDTATQQDLYRLDGATPAFVLDLSAQGIEIPIGDTTARIWTGGSLDGVVRVAYSDPFESRRYRVVEIDPSVPSATLASDFEINADFPTLAAAFGPQGTVYFVISESAALPGDPRIENLFRVDGNSLVSVADVSASGFQLGAGGMVSFFPAVDGLGLVRLLTRRDTGSYYSAFEIDPVSGTTSYRTAVKPASVFEVPGQPNGFASSEPVFGFDGTSFFVVDEDAASMTPRQGLYRHDFASVASRVVDISAQGIRVDRAGSIGNPPTGVALDASIRSSLPHPNTSGLRLLHRFDPVSGLAFFPTIVDFPADAGFDPVADFAAFGPGGEVYYITSSGGMPVQQGVWRLDAGVLTQVVDITGEGLELLLQSTPGPSIGVADDRTIQLLEPHPSIFDTFRLFRFDPSDGSAEVVADLDYSSLGSSPFFFRAEAFGPDGELFVVLGDSSFPSQQSVYRRDGSNLVPVADLTAQGIALQNFSMSSPAAAANSNGLVRVVDADMSTSSVMRVHAIDTGSGAAHLQTVVDQGALCCSDFGGMASSVPAFGREDDLYLLALGDGAAIDPQQSVYRMFLPEPGAALLQLTALAACAVVAAIRTRAQTA